MRKIAIEKSATHPAIAKLFRLISGSFKPEVKDTSGDTDRAERIVLKFQPEELQNVLQFLVSKGAQPRSGTYDQYDDKIVGPGKFSLYKYPSAYIFTRSDGYVVLEAPDRNPLVKGR